MLWTLGLHEIVQGLLSIPDSVDREFELLYSLQRDLLIDGIVCDDCQ